MYSKHARGSNIIFKYCLVAYLGKFKLKNVLWKAARPGLDFVYPQSLRPEAVVARSAQPYSLVLRVFFSFSGGFTPCRHLRPSSGRERTIV